MKPHRHKAPDGGYGWVVVMSAFLIMGLTAGVLKNFGLFFLDIQSHFDVPLSTVSWVTSTTIAMFHLGAPAASMLTLQFSQRAVIMGGGLLAASGMLLASLDLSLPWLYLSMGFLQGLGISFSWIPANSVVSRYFVHWRPFAFAVASSGECVFSFLFSPFFQWLIQTYRWRGALLIIGGLQLNLCVCGALMRPLPEDTESLAVAAAEPQKKKNRMNFQLLRKPEMLFYILFGVSSAAAFFIPPLFLVPFVSSLGVGDYWPAMVLSALAMADLAGRLICGWVANLRLARNLQLLATVVALQGVVLFLLPISHIYWAVVASAALYGFLFGCVVAVHVTSILDVVGLEGFDCALGLFMLFRSIGGFVGPPAAGWLVDAMEDYSYAFYLSGSCLVVSAAFVVLVDRLVQKRAAQTEGLESNQPA